MAACSLPKAPRRNPILCPAHVTARGMGWCTCRSPVSARGSHKLDLDADTLWVIVPKRTRVSNFSDRWL